LITFAPKEKETIEKEEKKREIEGESDMV